MLNLFQHPSLDPPLKVLEEKWTLKQVQGVAGEAQSLASRGENPPP
jgi:hypothetical protein